MLDICLNGDSETLENVTDLDSQYEVQDTVCLIDFIYYLKFSS
jgi:hypothetical protein